MRHVLHAYFRKFGFCMFFLIDSLIPMYKNTKIFWCFLHRGY